jgi:hypothetical protein
MKKTFVKPEVFVAEIESQSVFAASQPLNGGGEDSIWEGLDDEALVL